MTTFTDPVTYSTHGQEAAIALPSATAFNFIFGIGIALAAATLLISLATKNYVFGPAPKVGATTSRDEGL
jgi:hypothetical protein